MLPFQRLAVEIVVSGIAFSPDDFVKPWEAPDGDSERYVILVGGLQELFKYV